MPGSHVPVGGPHGEPGKEDEVCGMKTKDAEVWAMKGKDAEAHEMKIEDIEIRAMKAEDYDKVYRLWKTIKGFGIRSIDDSREGIERFLLRNPTTSIVACQKDQIVGAILCGHDGRRGCFYHVCVKEEYRKQGIGKKMAVAAMEALRAEHISKVNLIAFCSNEVGNCFWHQVGWTLREDLNYYDFTLNEKNITTFQ